MVKYVGLNVSQAVKLVTYNPAKIQGLEDKIGILVKNKKADIAVFDDDIDIKLTLVEGKILYNCFLDPTLKKMYSKFRTYILT